MRRNPAAILSSFRTAEIYFVSDSCELSIGAHNTSNGRSVRVPLPTITIASTWTDKIRGFAQGLAQWSRSRIKCNPIESRTCGSLIIFIRIWTVSGCQTSVLAALHHWCVNCANVCTVISVTVSTDIEIASSLEHILFAWILWFTFHGWAFILSAHGASNSGSTSHSWW